MLLFSVISARLEHFFIPKGLSDKVYCQVIQPYLKFCILIQCSYDNNHSKNKREN